MSLARSSLARPLSIRHIAGLRLRAAELAYLSACETTRAPTRLADEAVHVTSAFRMAGYAHVIGTLWSVNDLAATEISAAVYPTMARSGVGAAGAAHALDAAVTALRDIYQATPSRWAAHIHVGP